MAASLWPQWMRRYRLLHLQLDKSGVISDLEQGLPPGRRVLLHLPPGMVLFRRHEAPGLSQRRLKSALRLWASESLPLELDQYYLDQWPIPPAGYGLAALPRAMLDQARHQIEARQGRLAAVVAPELLPPKEPQPAVVLWRAHHTLLAMQWKWQRLVNWIALPASLSRAQIVELLHGFFRVAPKEVVISRRLLDDQPLIDACRQRWPRCRISPQAADDDHPLQAFPLLEFPGFLRQDEFVPATSSDRVRLASMGLAAVLGGFVYLYGETAYLERLLAHQHYATSMLKIRANRSEQIAGRSTAVVQAINDLRLMTVDRYSVMAVLKTLAESLPGRVKLESLNIERSGALILNGVAETEVDLSNLLRKLAYVPQFLSPRLTFSQQQAAEDEDQEQPVIGFRVELRLAEPLLQLPKDPDDEPGFPSPALSRIPPAGESLEA